MIEFDRVEKRVDVADRIIVDFDDVHLKIRRGCDQVFGSEKLKHDRFRRREYKKMMIEFDDANNASILFLYDILCPHV